MKASDTPRRYEVSAPYGETPFYIADCCSCYWMPDRDNPQVEDQAHEHARDTGHDVLIKRGTQKLIVPLRTQ